MIKKILLLVEVVILVFLVPYVSFAAGSFFEGKTIRIVVGFTPGGGFDTYSRALARHMGKYIPGNPYIIVENMPGAGSMIAANYVYKMAKPDSLTIGNVQGSIILDQVLGRKGIEYDVRKFEYVGIPVRQFLVVIFSKASGITSAEKWMASKTPVKIGTISGSSMTAFAKMLQRLTDLPVQPVEGYKGTYNVRLAVESGEVAGGVFGGRNTAFWSRALETGDMVAVMSTLPYPNNPNVPLINKFVKTEKDLQLFKTSNIDPDILAHLYLLPPGTPKEIVKIIREAFDKTMMDEEFLNEAKKANLEIGPINGEGVTKMVAELFKTPPSLVNELQEYYK